MHCKTRSSSAGSTGRILIEIDNPRAWIFRVALNAGRDARGAAWRRHRRALPDDGSQLVADACPPEANAIRNEELKMVRESIARLRPEEQEVFLLRQDGQMTYEQIAETIGPVGTVKTRMRLALKRLRQAVEQKADSREPTAPGPVPDTARHEAGKTPATEQEGRRAGEMPAPP